MATHLWLVGAESTVAERQTLKTDGELDIARSDNVLNLELGKLGVKAQLLDDTRILARGETRVILTLGTGDDHFARGKDQSSRLGVANTHNHSCETL